MSDLVEAVGMIKGFTHGSLRHKVVALEKNFSTIGNTKAAGQVLSTKMGIDLGLLSSALTIKRTANQIDEVVHTVGILLLLPLIMRDGEIIESLSLAAGNTGRSFDLTTNFRIAEFKFIDWKKKSNTIRENSIFKDFYGLAEAATEKERYLYVIPAYEQPLRFFNGGRSIKDVMGNKWSTFQSHHGDNFTKVREYYSYRKDLVQIVDVTQYIPVFSQLVDVQDPNKV